MPELKPAEQRYLIAAFKYRSDALDSFDLEYVNQKLRLERDEARDVIDSLRAKGMTEQGFAFYPPMGFRRWSETKNERRRASFPALNSGDRMQA